MGGQKIFFINFQKLHEMARKLNENFFGPPLHPKNSHFLSIILALTRIYLTKYKKTKIENDASNSNGRYS